MSKLIFLRKSCCLLFFSVVFYAILLWACEQSVVVVAMRRLDPLPVINLFGARGQVALSCKSTHWHVFITYTNISPISPRQFLCVRVCVCVCVCVVALAAGWTVSTNQG